MIVVFGIFLFAITHQAVFSVEPTEWQIYQHGRFETLIKQWQEEIFETWSSSILNIQDGIKCAETTVGLREVLSKLGKDIADFERQNLNGGSGNVQLGDLLRSIEKFKARSKFLGEEGRSEEPSTCIRKFRTNHGNVVQKIYHVEEQLKSNSRPNEIDFLVRSIQNHNVDPIIDLTGRDPSDLDLLLVEVIEKLFPNSAAMDSNFGHIYWILSHLGSQTPHQTDLLTELVLDKLKSFGGMASARTIQLAYASRVSQASQATRNAFPKQIQNLFWGTTGICIRNQESEFYLREREFLWPVDSDADQEVATVKEEGLIIADNCGWDIKPIGGNFNSTTLFKIVRKIDDPERTWSLSRSDWNSVFISSEPQSENFNWRLVPVRKNGNDLAFKIEAASTGVTKSLCQKPKKSGVNSYATETTVLETSLRLGPQNDFNCHWTLESI